MAERFIPHRSTPVRELDPRLDARLRQIENHLLGQVGSPANAAIDGWTAAGDSEDASTGIDTHRDLLGLEDDDHSQYVYLTPGETARNVIQPTLATVVPLTIKGAASQSANMIEWQDSSGLTLSSVAATGAMRAGVRDAATSTVSTALTIAHNTSGTAADGFGARQSWVLETSTTENTDAMNLTLTWAAATHASRRARAVWSIYDTAAREFMRAEADGSQAQIAFGGAVVTNHFVSLINPVSTYIPLLVRGAASQSANLSAWQTSAGVQLLSVNFDGTVSASPASFVHSSGSRILLDFTGTYTVPSASTGSIFGINGQLVVNFSNTVAPVSGVYVAQSTNAQVNIVESTISVFTQVIGQRLRAFGSGNLLGTMNGITGLLIDVWGIQNNPAGILTNATAVSISAPTTTSSGGGSVTNAVALSIGNVTGATSTNFAILTNGGTTRHLTGAVGVVGLEVRGAASQTADLQQWENSAGTTLSSVAANGNILSGLRNATTNAIDTVFAMAHNSSGTPAAGFGSRHLWCLESSTTEDRDAAAVEVSWVVATDASRTARKQFYIYDTAARECFRMEASGSAAMISFYGVGAVARPSAYTQTYSTADKTHANPTATALTDNSGGVANTTLEAISAGYVQSEVANNFADLAASNNALIADLADVKQLLNSVIDDLQSLGLFQ